MSLKINAELDFLPPDYPCIWANDALDDDEKPMGKWVTDVEYNQLWDDGWKYYYMLQYKYDSEYGIVFTTTSSSSKTKYTHIYVGLGELDNDVQIMDLKILGKSNELPTFDDNGFPLNGIAWRIINYRDLNFNQWPNRYYIGSFNKLSDVKLEMLYIAIWDSAAYFDNIINI
jgi:hypothetical protein